VTDFSALPGRGVTGRIGGRRYHLGNHRLIEDLRQCSPALEVRLQALEQQGKTTVLLTGEDGVLAVFGVADTVKESSREAIADLHRLVADMLDTMHAANGAGLAAPQIGEDWQVVVFGTDAPNPRYPDAPVVPRTVLLNPVITPLGDAEEEGWEGCLSVPEVYDDVERPARVKIRYRDYAGQEVVEDAEGLFAVCIQHEMDHLKGVLFIDRELSSQTLRYLIGRCDYFVASRFHAMVSSLAMAVPTLVIGWSHKYQEVLEMFQLDEWAFGHDKLEPDFLRERFEALVAAGDEVRDRLRTHLPAVKARSLAQADLIGALTDVLTDSAWDGATPPRAAPPANIL